MKQVYSSKRAHAGKTRTSGISSGSPTVWIRHLSKSLLITLGIGGALLLLFSLALYFCADPNKYLPTVSLISLGITAFFGGLIAVRVHGHSALICGLANGALLTLISLLLSLFAKGMSENKNSFWIGLLMRMIILMLSVLGAYLGLNRPKKKRNARKR